MSIELLNANRGYVYSLLISHKELKGKEESMNHFNSSAGKVHWALVLALLLILVGGFVSYRV